MKRFGDIPIRQKLVAIIMVTSTMTFLFTGIVFLFYEFIPSRQGILQPDWQKIVERSGQYALIGLLVLFVSFIIAFFLSSKLQEIISRPISHLAEIVGIISSKKNYAIRADIDNDDELGLLVTQFNEMLAQIQKRDRKIQAAHDELEKRVAERTEDLQGEINERKQTEIALRESRERYALAMRGANDGLWDWDLLKNTLYFSPRWKTMLGYKEEEIGEDPDEWFKLIHPQEREALVRAIMGHIDGSIPQFEQEHRMRHSDGSYRWMLSRGLAVRDLSGKSTRMAGSQSDITARRLAEDQLYHHSLHDKLTALPNRALLLERIGRAISRSKRRKDDLFAVLYLNLDRFKVVNDSLGHDIGDELLIAVARRLEKALRTQDTVARISGDEFAVLLDELGNMADASRLTHRIQEELKQPFNLHNQEVFMTASIGTVFSSIQFENPEDLLRDADTAMYRAKHIGPGQCQIFNLGMHEKTMKLLGLESDLRKALLQKELRLLYQPIISLTSGEIIGFEALIRWIHPKRGMVNPVDFIPLAEDTGLIIPIGAWVIQEACRQISAWQKAFPREKALKMTVNLSGKQFARADLIPKVDLILRETQPEPGSIGFEITESVIMENTKDVTSMLKQLQARGIRLYLDDFGTGYSSLSYLHRFPIDVLKIDRSFVNRLGQRGKQTDIIQAIITLGHSQGISIVAEGIETAAQLEHLKSLHCEYGQGYLFSKPTDEKGIEVLLSSRLQAQNAELSHETKKSHLPLETSS